MKCPTCNEEMVVTGEQDFTEEDEDENALAYYDEVFCKNPKCANTGLVRYVLSEEQPETEEEDEEEETEEEEEEEESKPKKKKKGLFW